MYSNVIDIKKEGRFSKLNDTALSYDKDKTLGELFEKQVEATPDSIALIFESEKITYRELNNKANQLAWRLRDIGINRGDLVAIILNRSIEMVVAILGVLKSGAAYIPIDPNYPDERVQYMISFSNASLVLYSEDVLSGIRYTGPALKMNDSGIKEQKTVNPPVISKPQDLAYVIFTSGSTGKPKGVMIEQQAVNNFFAGITKLIDFSPSKKILGLTTISFDIFVLETFLPLFTGTQIVLANEQQQIDSKFINNLIINHQVDMIQITPSRLQMLLAHPKSQESLSIVKEIMVGGEAFPKSLLEALNRFPSLRIFNMYGPTETTVWSTVKELTGTDKITIGKPIANTQIYILNDDSSLVDEGETGELCISGDGLARGYLNDMDKTNERFIDHPFIKGARIYKTGDLARLLRDGEVEVLGRNDSQVKIRGYRIELKEIEEVLTRYDKISNCAVLALDDNTGYKYLAAFYTASSVLDESGIREYLSLYLPVYMLPSVFVHIEKFPLTPNGKLDRKALPLPQDIYHNQIRDSKHETELSGTKIQQEILKIWIELLPSRNIGLNDNFFDIGGNSFQLVMMSSMINELYPDMIEVADIFANPTICRLADFIEGKNTKTQYIHEFDFPILEFPDSYIQDSYEDSVVLCLSIDSEKMKYVDYIASNYGLSSELVFISLFLFLLSEVTGNKLISVSSLLEEDIIRKMTVDFSSFEDLAEVLIKVKETSDNLSSNPGYPLDKVKAFVMGNQKKPGSILLSDRIVQTQGLEKVFDIIFKVDNQLDKYNLLLEFNASNFKQSRMKEFLDNYLQLIEMLTCALEDS